MKRFLGFRVLLGLTVALASCALLSAVEPSGIPAEVTELITAPDTTLKLWPSTPPGGIPEGIGEEKWTPGNENPPIVRVGNVSIPTLGFYPAENPNGACVVIFPGGGFEILAYNLEGTEIAQWLNSIGVSAVIVKYRVPLRAGLPKHYAPLQDAQRAIRLTRAHAEEWGIDPSKIGVLGFSAGGRLTVAAALDYDVKTYDPIDEADELSARPDFAIPIYPAYLMDDERDMKASTPLSDELNIREGLPPFFISVAGNDENRPAAAARFFIQLKEVGVPCELHIPVKGGHGYGLRSYGGVASEWGSNCEKWMRAMNILP